MTLSYIQVKHCCCHLPKCVALRQHACVTPACGCRKEVREVAICFSLSSACRLHRKTMEEILSPLENIVGL